MKTLLLHLSCFLLTLSAIVSVAVIVASIFRKQRPLASGLIIWTCFALSCMATVAVALTAGYTSMKKDFENVEVLCADFGMKLNPDLNMSDYNWKSEANNAAAILIIFNNAFPLLETLVQYVTIALCIAAVISVFVVLKFLLKEQKRDKAIEIIYTELLKNSQPPGYKRMDPEISYIGKNEPAGMTAQIPKPHLTKKINLEPAIICIILNAVALLGVFLLTQHAIMVEEAALQKYCVPFDNFTPAYEHKVEEMHIHGERSHLKASDGEKSEKYPLHITSRKEWVTKPPMAARPLEFLASYVVVFQSANESCLFQKDYIKEIHHAQLKKMDQTNGSWGMSSNFLVTRDGRIYEGRGWNLTADPANPRSRGTFGVLFTGTTHRRTPQEKQLMTFKDLIDEGLRSGHIGKNYTLIIHPIIKRSILDKLFKGRNYLVQ